MEFTLNGEKRSYEGNLDLALSRYLREEVGITSCKSGCSGQGACGGCTILMNEKAILSCTTPMKQVEGKAVVTPDGLEQKIQDVFARAFILKGGVQCGFCTPGMVMAARALLLNQANPTRRQIKKAIQRNLCRCTGYKKIVDAILLAAAVLRGDQSFPAEIRRRESGHTTGKTSGLSTVLGNLPFAPT